jgi:NitT/TauT family transport system substrate-binding protein
MGCIIADGDFATYNKEAVNEFLEEYKASIDYIGDSDNIDSAAEYVVETGVMGAIPAAKNALTNLSGSICYIDGDNMETSLKAFYAAIGIAQPDDSFYYAK